MFNLYEISHWLGLSCFEIFTHMVALLVFTILLTLKLEKYLPDAALDWFGIFSPLFLADLCNGYFTIIVVIRSYDLMKRQSINRFMWSVNFLVLMIVFKYLLCLKLSGQSGLEFSEVFSPVFILLQLIAVRACNLF